ncbi:multicopper oxidase domain-containing protein [Nitrosomonas supralitoralis]|uniref:Copper oxidase n=1 Tax=Nitrosomonas supralitoralis TaxID=2116706 RepID=A0A2P7NRK8_9PROT|nr:multicopper oxidase domain-containing protein [Nitrosomonas supralitoralis]PSJ16068.1 copper oxidase [Nitrosomonas supralitoralis]
MKHRFDEIFSMDVRHSQCNSGIPRLSRPLTEWMVIPALIVSMSFFLFGDSVHANEKDSGHTHNRADKQEKKKPKGNLHRIEMFADKLVEGEDFLAYRMMLHEVTDKKGNTTDITNRYSREAIIPGPTIIMNEGDIAEITLFNQVPNPDEVHSHENVSLHVHGVHYEFHSDGTLKYINLSEDQGATLVQSYTYRWDAAPGTAGTWPYHDHNMNTHNGAEDKGLFGALIVNPASDGVVSISQGGNSISVPLSSIKKDYVLYILDDIFIGTEIDTLTGEQTPIMVNPTLTATSGSNVRFHLLALGTNLHQFTLPGYSWVEPGTNKLISEKAIGPLEKHVFAIQASADTFYQDATFSGKTQRMVGEFNVNP